MISDDYSAIVETPLPYRFGIVVEGGALVQADWLGAEWPVRPPASGAREAVRQIAAYFGDARSRFDLPLTWAGTAFQHRVWTALRQIPPGRVRRYGELAGETGGGARAVGNACRANPLALLVPCHRVVGAANRGGYMGAVAGWRMDIKRWLLSHEGIL